MMANAPCGLVIASMCPTIRFADAYLSDVYKLLQHNTKRHIHIQFIRILYMDMHLI